MIRSELSGLVLCAVCGKRQKAKSVWSARDVKISAWHACSGGAGVRAISRPIKSPLNATQSIIFAAQAIWEGARRHPRPLRARALMQSAHLMRAIQFTQTQHAEQTTTC